MDPYTCILVSIMVSVAASTAHATAPPQIAPGHLATGDKHPIPTHAAGADDNTTSSDSGADTTGNVGDPTGQTPILTLTPAFRVVREYDGLAVRAEALDPDGDPVRVILTDQSFCDNDDCSDSPELVHDPARPSANLYWVPGAGRAGSTHTATFIACDDTGLCSEPRTARVRVTSRARPTATILNERDVTVSPAPDEASDEIVLDEGKALSIRGVSVTLFGRLDQPRPTLEVSPATLQDGPRVLKRRATTQPPVAHRADLNRLGLQVELEPPLDGDNDAPQVRPEPSPSPNEKTFRVVWVPNRTRGAMTYTMRLVPTVNGRPAATDNNTLSFRIRVEDRPLISFPGRAYVIRAGETADFTVETDGTESGKVSMRAISVPDGARFDAASGHFTWATTARDTGRSHQLVLALNDGQVAISQTIQILVADKDGNLIVNPDLLFDTDHDRVPDGWTRLLEDIRNGHILRWDAYTSTGALGSRPYLVSERTASASASPTWFGWIQTIPLHAPGMDVLTDTTVFELTVEYRFEDVRPNIEADGSMASADGMGVLLQFYDAARRKLPTPIRASMINMEAALDASSWSDADGCYHELSSLDSDWRRERIYTTLPANASYARIRTVNRSHGRVYFRRVSLRPVSDDPDTPAFARSGEIPFIHDASGQPVFVIGLTHQPPIDYDGQPMPLSVVRDSGFNTVTFAPSRLAEHVASGLYALGNVQAPPYRRVGGGNGFKVGMKRYDGLQENLQRARQLADAADAGLDVLLLEGPDEANYRVELDGAPPNLDELNYAADRITAIIDRPYMLNVMALNRDPIMEEGPASLADVVSLTINNPNAYATRTTPAYLAATGRKVRAWQYRSAFFNGGMSKPLMGFGFGVSTWSGWNGRLEGPRLGEFLPFHLQRFQVYNQIVNGACGVRFYTSNSIDLRDVYERHHWDQIVELASELADLEDVLTVPRFEDRWSADADLEAMLKSHDGRTYLIATNPSEQDLGDVTITIAPAGSIRRVTALFENEDSVRPFPMITPDDDVIDDADAAQVRRRGLTNLQWKRDVEVNDDGVSFTDRFIDYAVHVYELELDTGTDTQSMPQ